jgi:serine/threonine protein kinase
VLVQKNIIHRDIKIENILLHDDKIKVADFGFCQKLELNSFAYKRLGSPLFMAPEILWQMPYDGRCDIYSLGCLLYNLLYGKNPYHETDINRLMMKI